MPQRYRDEDLLHWRRYPGNVTGDDLAKAAEARGWSHMRTSGSHAIFRKGNRTLSIPLQTRADGTKRDIIEAMLEDAE